MLSRRNLLKGTVAAGITIATPKILYPLMVKAQSLDPIIVVGSLEDIQLQAFSNSGVLTGLNSSFVLTTPSQAQAFVDALKALVLQQRQQAQLTNTMVIPAPLVSEPPPLPVPVPESYLFGDEQNLFQANLQAQGLSEAQSLTALVALQAALAPVEIATGHMMNTGIKLLATGMAAGLTLGFVDIAGGLMIVIPAGIMAAIGIGTLIIIVYKILPEVRQQISVFGHILFQYDVQIEFLPSEIPVVQPITKESTPENSWSNEQWNEWYMLQDNPYGTM